MGGSGSMTSREPRTAAKLYFHWLWSQITLPEEHGYWDLLGELHMRPFAWSVPNDDNRVADGVALRQEFLTEFGGRAFDEEPTASVLEVLIALSRHLAFQADGTSGGWAWTLIQNLELHNLPDPLYEKHIEMITEILDNLIWRQYAPDGQGGFFPLGFPQQDQTKVEIWYQMAAYLEERHPEQ